MQEVWFNSMKQFIKTGAVIVAEFSINGNQQKMRSIVTRHDAKNHTIKTIYGDVRPFKMYAVTSFAEANKFIQEGAK